jgi:hypothetical protein
MSMVVVKYRFLVKYSRIIGITPWKIICSEKKNMVINRYLLIRWLFNLVALKRLSTLFASMNRQNLSIIHKLLVMYFREK